MSMKINTSAFKVCFSRFNPFVWFKCYIIVVFLSLLTNFSQINGDANAKLRELETTRLMSTSGAGIGSVLLNEAAILNPASIYFFRKSSLYYQNGGTTLNEESEARNDSSYKDGKNQMFLITDTSAILKGGISYQTQSENGESRTRFTSSAASHLGKNASFGILYRYTHEDTDKYRVFHQATFGITYVINKKLVLGGILADPFLANKEDTRLASGLQYSLSDDLLLMTDAGLNYTENSKDNSFWKAALQAQFFDSIFIKYGVFEDKIEKLKGNSWGASWIGPKMAFEYAFKSSRAFENGLDFFNGERFDEHSFAVSVVF